jgi:putative hydrolase of the HAD superfamily
VRARQEGLKAEGRHNNAAAVHLQNLYFKGGISAAHFGVAKPHASIFHGAALLAGVQPHEVLHVGDDAHADCVGALAAGMQVAWLNREGHDWSHGDTRPHLEVRDLHQLCASWPDYAL